MRLTGLSALALSAAYAGTVFATLAGCAGPVGLPAAARLSTAGEGQDGASGPGAGPQRRYDYRPADMATAKAPVSAAKSIDAVAPRGPHDLRPEDMVSAMAMPGPTRAPLTPTPVEPSVTPTPQTPTATRTFTPTRTASPTPTATPTLSYVERIEAAWTLEAATPVTPTAPPMPRPRSALDTLNAGDLLSAIALPGTLAGVHFAGPEITAAKLFGGEPSVTAWAAEVAYASDEGWEADTAKAMLDLHERGFRTIVRVDYSRKQHIPPVDNPYEVEAYAQAFVRLHRRTGRWAKFFVVGNEGNIDEGGSDTERRTECLAGRHLCSPEAHATAYRAVRRALVGETDAYVLLGAPSPGTTDHPARWMDGVEYLKAVLEYLHPSEVDGIALHSYAPESKGQPQHALAAFAAELEAQIEAAEEMGYLSTPLFVTEMNQVGTPDPHFITAAYAWIDAHNARSHQDIVAACWFVYYDETNDWGSMALENSPAAVRAFSGVGKYPPGR